MALRAFLDHLKEAQIVSEDGNRLSISLNKGAHIEEIDFYENRLKAKLPEEFKELLLYSNGMNYFGLTIQSIIEQEYLPARSMISIHNWGNGDRDCIVVDSRQERQYPEGQMVFHHYKTNQIVPITGNMELWFQDVYAEIKINGCLRHPDDYLNKDLNPRKSILRFRKKESADFQNSQGLYANVAELLLHIPDKRSSDIFLDRAYYKNGHLSSEYVYVGGKLHGITRHWYENGNMKCEIHYVNGKSHGRNIIWDENGNLIAEGLFKEGKIWEGEFLFVNEKGNKIIEQYTKGKLIASTNL